MPNLKLGQEVKDRITGYNGIVISITNFLNGCKRLQVQPKWVPDKPFDPGEMFDEPDLELIGNGICKEKEIKVKKPTHGDRKFFPQRSR